MYKVLLNYVNDHNYCFQVEFENVLKMEKLEVFVAYHAGGVANIEVFQNNAFRSVFTHTPRNIPGIHKQIVAVDIPDVCCINHIIIILM